MSIKNTTNPTNYLLHVPDNGLTESIQMNVQVYKPPVIEISGIDIPSGPTGRSRSMVPSTTFKYKPFTVSVLVDESFQTWLEMYQWALAINDYHRYRNKAFEDVSNVSMFMHILDNHKRNTVLIHEFTSPFPSLIYPPTFNHTASTDYPMIMNVEFKYHTLNILDGQGNVIRPRKSVEDARDDMYNNIKEEYVLKDEILRNNVKPNFKG